MSIEVKAWKCEKCGKAYLDKTVATNCCVEKKNICEICGCEIKSPWLKCHDCREKERFEKAEKVRYSIYGIEYLWDETQQEYFRDAEDLAEKYGEDAYEERGVDVELNLPTWCYGCVGHTFGIDIERAIEKADESMYEDFDLEKSVIGLRELRDFIKAWNAKQTAKSYDVNYKTVVLLNE